MIWIYLIDWYNDNKHTSSRWGQNVVKKNEYVAFTLAAFEWVQYQTEIEKNELMNMDVLMELCVVDMFLLLLFFCCWCLLTLTAAFGWAWCWFGMAFVRNNTRPDPYNAALHVRMWPPSSTCGKILHLEWQTDQLEQPQTSHTGPKRSLLADC